jgi:hypothetical protein
MASIRQTYLFVSGVGRFNATLVADFDFLRGIGVKKGQFPLRRPMPGKQRIPGDSLVESSSRLYE